MDPDIRNDLKAHAKALWNALALEPFDETAEIAVRRQLNGIFDLASCALLAPNRRKMLHSTRQQGPPSGAHPAPSRPALVPSPTNEGRGL
jgi:hypothetical protein